MILSVSRRTDVPNYYFDWFLNRIKEGFLYVRNPMNAHQISKIPLSADMVDCIVFWTKNPANALERLDELKGYQYYFQFTLTGYGKDVEPNIPDKKREIIPTFIKLSERIGKKRVIWRYDPIFISDKYTAEYHLRAFEEIAKSLSGYTDKVVISFVDMYDKTKRNTTDLNIKNITAGEMKDIAGKMYNIANNYGLVMETCAEQIDLSDIGISHGSCIDRQLIEELIGCEIKVSKDKNQRDECGCVESVEIGSYNTCTNGCKYCYANFSPKSVEDNVRHYNPNSPLLCGIVRPDETVTERKVKSLKDMQMSLI